MRIFSSNFFMQYEATGNCLFFFREKKNDLTKLNREQNEKARKKDRRRQAYGWMEVCNRNRSSTQHQKYIHPAIERTYISFIQLAPKSFIWLSSYLDIGIHIQFRLIRSYVRSWVRFHCVHACHVCMPFTCSCVCCHAKPSRKKKTQRIVSDRFERNRG